ncbi:unnamed protein product [Timema podura]|uniref:OSK domain-containing protein n=1 Tax=Timema podura TaxID=61482 RepID=A0ABN7P5U5_TIMPD|nr:unnamed protein product [Timema podura]
MPEICSYQLIGDSLLLRFAEKILGQHSKLDSESGKYVLGLCVNGQNLKQLKARIKERKYPISENVIVLIGTNDLLQSTPRVDMERRMLKLVKKLQEKAKRIIILTLPPVPRLAFKQEHWKKLLKYNKFLLTLESEDSIRVADIYPLYVTAYQTCKMAFFEKFFTSGRKKNMKDMNPSQQIRFD